MNGLTRAFVVRIWETIREFPDEKPKLKILHPAAFSETDITKDLDIEVGYGGIHIHFRGEKVTTLNFSSRSGRICTQIPHVENKSKEEIQKHFDQFAAFKKWRIPVWHTEPGYRIDYYTDNVKVFCLGVPPLLPVLQTPQPETLTSQGMLADMEQLIRSGIMNKERVRERLTKIK